MRPVEHGSLPAHERALLGGIGFTVSLFVGALAFPTSPELHIAKIGVLSGSVLSAIARAVLLRLARSEPVGIGSRWAVEKPPRGDIGRNLDVTRDGNPVTTNSLVNQVGLVEVK